MHVDRSIGVGTLNEEGWWNFDRISLFQNDVEKCPECNEIYTTQVLIQSIPNTGQFKLKHGIDNSTMTYNRTLG